MLRARFGASILHCDHSACGRSSLYDYAKKMHNLVTRRRGRRFYRDEIEIQEARTTL